MTGANGDSLPTDSNGTERGDSEPVLGEDQNLVIVSNRQPYSHYYEAGDDGNREVSVDRPAGGLTAGLDPVVQQVGGTWIAWGDGEADREVTGSDGTVKMPPESKAYTLRRIWLSDDEIEGYYYGYSNRVLWPLCHGGVWKTEFAERYWQRYRQVNETFAEVVEERTTSNSVVWFQDYHFALAPQMVRESVPESTFLLHFWHITWPGWDTFRACPQAERLLEGLLGNDLLGFHIDRYCENFLDCVDNGLQNAFVDHDNNRVRYDGHTTHVKSFPMGVDAPAIERTAESVSPSFWSKFTDTYDIDRSTRIAVGVDRLDYTKGIVERLNTLERLWETSPEWRGELTYVQKADESRSLIPEYRDLQQTVVEAVKRINDRFSTDTWQPIVYIDDWLTDEELYGLYRYSDVMIVSALRDGMNLVAKEFIAAQVDCGDPKRDATDKEWDNQNDAIRTCGVLVLSDQTGAHEELGEYALTVNPYDTDAFATTIEQAVMMETTDRNNRMTSMRESVASNDIYAWMDEILSSTQ
ncbi:alpha,alpha-trehalose-phosphate synthase (UDP-forming) [Halocatena marina]|uniref:alpha,alpha-trehalose-phosphate synthase (UDP-forming) n=1 Tax=Halocatena marina TaxID=2934937 RepID=UPI0022249C59|nr:trehalose-6-phosphate synthase [Halocatena marina]